MKSLIVAFLMVFAVILAFITGVFTAQSGLMVAGFCGLPFAMFALGWAAKSTLLGKRIMLVPLDHHQPMEMRAPVNHAGDHMQGQQRRLTRNNVTDEQV